MTRGTRLSGTILQDAHFEGANLRGTDFSGAVSVNTAHFDGADVTCALFPKTFDKSHLANAIVTGVKLLPPGAERTLDHAVLTNARQRWPVNDLEWQQLRDDCGPRSPSGTQTPTTPQPGQNETQPKP